MNIMSESVDQLFTALAQAQGELKLVERTSNNPFFKSKYADLGSFLKESRDILSRHGLSVTQVMSCEGNTTILITILGHKSGQWIQGKMPVLCSKNTPQEMGSAITYARRYAFAAITGMTGGDDDDDANTAEAGIRLQSQISKGEISQKMTEDQIKEVREIFLQFPVLKDNILNGLKERLGREVDVMEIPQALFPRIQERAKQLKLEKSA